MYSLQDQDLTPEQVIQLTSTMISVAKANGVDPAETVLIREFYENARSEDMPPTDAMLESQAESQFNFDALAGGSPEFADALVYMGLMTAYADGSLSQEERGLVKSIAKATGMDDELLAKHLSRVHDEAVRSLSHLPDSGLKDSVLAESPRQSRSIPVAAELFPDAHK